MHFLPRTFQIYHLSHLDSSHYLCTQDIYPNLLSMRYLNLFVCLFFFYSCTSQSTPNVVEGAPDHVKSYGTVITDEGRMNPEELKMALAEKDTVDCTFSGVIQETCAMKGCWMTMDAGMGEDMRVTFKDYGFFVPKEGQSGREAVLKGKAYKSVTEVDMLRHYAEDAGKSKEEVMAITEPEVAISFEAEGVLIYE